jgi:hypothetical protein
VIAFTLQCGKAAPSGLSRRSAVAQHLLPPVQSDEPRHATLSSAGQFAWQSADEAAMSAQQLVLPPQGFAGHAPPSPTVPELEPAPLEPVPLDPVPLEPVPLDDVVPLDDAVPLEPVPLDPVPLELVEPEDVPPSSLPPVFEELLQAIQTSEQQAMAAAPNEAETVSREAMENLRRAVETNATI